MRITFEAQLLTLKEQLQQMGGLCEQAIATAIRALTESDSAAIEQVQELESQIDQSERDIEALCMKLLLHQQPVARDLRQISSALKMISDMERIGDQALDIGEICRYLQGHPHSCKTHLKFMAQQVIHMVTTSVDSYIRQDLAMAKAVIGYDDQVDESFERIKQELISLIAGDSESGEYYLDLLMVAKYLERIGDHATNIAEWVEYAITGSRAL